MFIGLPLAHRHQISLAYLGNYYFYSRYGQNDHLDHNINFDARFTSPRGWEVRLGQSYRAATEGQSPTVTQQRRYERFVPYLLASYTLAERWSLEGAYQYNALNFISDAYNQDNYRLHTGGLTLFYKIRPKTALLTQYVINFTDYPNSSISNNMSHTPFLGITWDPTAKLSGTIKVGYTLKSYDTTLPLRNNNPSSLAIGIQTLYRYSRYSQFSFIAQRAERDDADYNNNSYTNSAVYLNWSKDWHFIKSNLNLGVSYVNNSYTNPSFDSGAGQFKVRQDNILSFGIGISRPFTRWLKLRFDYYYTNTNSNFTNYSYNDNLIMFGFQGSI